MPTNDRPPSNQHAVRYPRPRYQCAKCNARWETKRPQVAQCPRCGSASVKWLNSGFWTGGKDGNHNRDS